jgi:hypothetical protein
MRIPTLVLGALLGAALVAGCSAIQPVYDGQVADHSIDDFERAPKAVYANQVPIHPHARLVDATGSESWGDAPDSFVRGMGWEFEFPGEMEPMIAFYDAALPAATREVMGDGEVMWTFAPRGARPGEEVMVRVGRGRLWINEAVKPAGRRSS